MKTSPNKYASISTNLFTWQLIRYKPWLFGLVALGWIAYHLWPLLPGLLVKVFFDTITGVSSNLSIWQIIVLAILLGLGRSVVLLTIALSGPRWSISIGGLLQRNMLARILERPGATALPESNGAALSTMRDDVEMMRLALDWWFDALAGLLLAAGGISILLWVDVRITLLVFVPIVVVIILASAARTRLETAREQSRTATAAVTGAIGEIFGAVQAIQVATAEGQVIDHLQQLGMQRRKLVLHDRLQSLALDGLFTAIASLGAGLTLIVAAEQFRNGTFSIGDFALFAAYLLQVAEYTGFLGYLLRSYRQVAVSIQRGILLLQGAPAAALVEHHPIPLQHTASAPFQIEPVATAADYLERMELRTMTLRYPGGGGVEDICLSIGRSELLVVTGRMGSGKTTLLRLALGLLEAQHGDILWNGQSIECPAEWMRPPRVAYTAQVPGLLSGSLRENMLLGLSSDLPGIQHALRIAAFDQDVEGFTNGIETAIGTRGMRLSGGQVQRLAAARMLIRQSELLVIDDLSSALDRHTEEQLWRRLMSRTNYKDERPAILAVSYRKSLLQQADHILVLDQGRMLAQGCFKHLMDTSELFRSLVLEK